jgi:hypothetical protein
MSKMASSDWWPLRVAFVWVFSRDLDFVHRITKARWSTLDSALNLYCWSYREIANVEERDDVWPRLREAISAGLIQARGVPFENTTKGRRDSHEKTKDTRTKRENDDDELFWSELLEEELSPEPEGTDEVELPADECLRLVPDGPMLEAVLRPEYGIITGGRSWRDIIIKREDLLKSFPPIALQTVKSFDHPRQYKQLLANRGILALWGSKGPPPSVTEERRFQAVDQWVREHGEKKDVSKATVNRAWRKLRLGNRGTERS